MVCKNFFMKMAIWVRGHISRHEKPKLNDNIKDLFVVIHKINIIKIKNPELFYGFAKQSARI